MANSHRVAVTLLLVGILALTSTCQTSAQTAFPIGLRLKYLGSYAVGEQVPQYYTYEYEVLRWATEIGSGVLEARTRENLTQPSWTTIYYHNTTWREYNASGTPTPYYQFPPLWIAVGGLQDGGQAEFRMVGGNIARFNVTAGHHVIVATGAYTCWDANYSYSDGTEFTDYDLLYECRVGVLIKGAIHAEIPVAEFQYTTMCQLTESNFEDYVPPPPPPNLLPLLLLAGGGVTAAVAISVVAVVLVHRRRTRADKGPAAQGA